MHVPHYCAVTSSGCLKRKVNYTHTNTQIQVLRFNFSFAWQPNRTHMQVITALTTMCFLCLIWGKNSTNSYDSGFSEWLRCYTNSCLTGESSVSNAFVGAHLHIRAPWCSMFRSVRIPGISRRIAASNSSTYTTMGWLLEEDRLKVEKKIRQRKQSKIFMNKQAV